MASNLRRSYHPLKLLLLLFHAQSNYCGTYGTSVSSYHYRSRGGYRSRGVTTPNRVLAQDLDEPCAGKSGADLFGFYGVDTDKIYRRIGGFRVVVRQKHAEMRSKCHFEAIWGPAGQMERRRTSFVYHAWAVTTCIEAFVLLVAALAPFTSFAAGTARPLADYQRWHS